VFVYQLSSSITGSPSRQHKLITEDQEFQEELKNIRFLEIDRKMSTPGMIIKSAIYKYYMTLVFLLISIKVCLQRHNSGTV
jgi:hypothetical protein